MKTSEDDFLKALQQTFGYRLGRFIQVGRRVLYPLKQVIMPQTVSNSVVFIGNAAHTLHPVAGQGFNLGLRDVATLAQYIAKEGLSTTMLRHYQQARHHDQAVITRLTDNLVGLFTHQLPGLSIARGLGLMTLDNSTLLKKLLSRYARGFGGVIPDLVCGIPLQRSADELII
jgi:2-octaprenyl-6-methoxyphenol hydroxylase